MAHGDQLLGQPGHNPLGSSVKRRWDAFHQGGDLCNSHMKNLRPGLMHNEISRLWVPIFPRNGVKWLESGGKAGPPAIDLAEATLSLRPIWRKILSAIRL